MLNKAYKSYEAKAKILIVYKFFLASRGGIQKIMENIAHGVASSFIVDFLVCRKFFEPKKIKWNNSIVYGTIFFCQILSLPLAPLYVFWLLLKARKYNIINYHYPFPLVDVALSIYLPKKTKLVIHWHADIVAQKKTYKLILPLIKRCLNKATAIVVASDIHINNSNLLKNYIKKCIVIPFGEDLKYWSNIANSNTKDIAFFKKKYGKFILAVGRTVAYKGYEVLITAMRNIECNLIIVGDGPLTFSLKNLAKTYGIENRVHLLGSVNQEILKAIYMASYFLVLPSITANEAFGIVQIEAMACGKPVINTKLSTAVPWVARNNIEALTVAPQDSILLESAIRKLLSDRELYIRLSMMAIERVRGIFNLEIFNKNTLELYKSLLN